MATCPSLEFFIDGTQHRIQRPQYKEQITDAGRRAQYLSATAAGKSMTKPSQTPRAVPFPPPVFFTKTPASKATNPLRPLVRLRSLRCRFFTPRKSHGVVNSVLPKETNRMISAVRILVEHVINGVKRCRIVKDILRNHHTAYDDLAMETACGLDNFRITKRVARA